jgi:hypothetical protein
MGDTSVAHLLAWEYTEAEGTWWAWVSWISESGGRPQHTVVTVRASRLQPLDDPEPYQQVPRRVRGRDGVIRPWSGEITGRLAGPAPRPPERLPAASVC